MPQPCQFLAPNGNESLLYARLHSLFGPDKAASLWYDTKTDQFDQLHGKAPKEERDANGEPKTQWILDKLQVTAPKHEEVPVSEFNIDKLKAKALAHPETTYIIKTADKANNPRIYAQLSTAGLTNIRFEGPLKAIQEQYNTAPSVALPGGESIKIEGHGLDQQRKQLSLVREDGRYWTSNEQEELLGIAMHSVYNTLVKQNKASVAELREGLIGHLNKLQGLYDKMALGLKIAELSHISEERAGELSSYIRSARGQMDKVFSILADRLQRKGIQVKGGAIRNGEGYDETPTEQNEQVETAGRGLRDWSSVVFELNPADTASAHLKLILSVIPKTIMENGKPVEQRGMFGSLQFEDYDQVFQQTLGLLSQTEPVLGSYLSALRSQDRGYYHKVAEVLENSPVHIQNEFMTVMNKANQSYKVTLWNTDPQGNFNSFQVEGNRYSMTQSVMTGWKELQKSSALVHTGSDGSMSLNQNLLRQLQERVRSASKLPPNELKLKAPNLIRDLFQAHGISLPNGAIDGIVSRIGTITKATDKEGDLKRQFQVSTDGKPVGLFSALVFAESAAEGSALSLGNPLYENQKSLSILAKAVLPYMDKIYSTSHNTIDGKKVWDYTLHSSITRQVEALTGNRKVLDAYANHPFTRNNYLVKAFTTDPRLMHRFNVGILEGMRENGQDTDGVLRKDMSPREQAAMALSMFTNNGKDFGNFLSLTHADKTTSPVFEGVPRVDVYNQSSINEVYRGIVRSEHARATDTNYPSTSAQFEQGRSKFYFIPEMNSEGMDELVAKKVLAPEDKAVFYDQSGKLLPWNDRMLPVIDKVAKWHTRELTRDVQDLLYKTGVFTKDKLMLDSRYISKAAAKMGLSWNKSYVDGAPKNDYFLSTTDGKIPITQEKFKALVAEYASRDFGVNSFLFNTSLSQLFYGDPAEAFKKDFRSTMVEFEKRLAKDIAPASSPNWEPGETYRALALEDFIDKAPYIGKAFNHIDATDAQELITVEEHLYTEFKSGKIDQQTYQEMTDIIRNANGGTYTFTKASHKAVPMPISKPVYAGKRDVENGDFQTDYIKSAALILHPEMTRGHEIDQLRQLMERNGIRRAAFKSAIKMGAPADLLKVYNQPEGYYMHNEFDKSIMTLKRENLGIQQTRPNDDETHNEVGVVTQMHRLITQGIDGIKDFKFNGSERSGKDMRGELESVTKGIVQANINTLNEKIGNSKENLYDWMVNQGNVNKFNPNDLMALSMRDSNGEPIVPLAFNGASSKFSKMVLSQIRSAIKFKVPGTSFVQATGAGFKTMLKVGEQSEFNKLGIIYRSDYDGSGLRSMTRDESGSKPAQVIVPFSYLKKFHPNITREDIIVDGRIDMNKVPRDILQMVMARIPNQGYSSMLPAEIVGFLPDSMSDTIIVPSAITKQMGSDFDVDKLFTYANAHSHELVKGEDGIKSFQVKAQEKGTIPDLMKRYFDLHWSILTHPEMYNKIMTPLDREDLKNEVTQQPYKNFFSPAYQLESFLSQKDAKVLVGRIANTQTGNAMFQPHNIRLGYKSVGEGGKVEEHLTPIKVKDEYGHELELTHLSGEGQSMYSKKDGDFDHTETRSKQDNIVTTMNEILDHAKNRTIDAINLNSYTFGPYSQLLRLSTAGDTSLNVKFPTRLIQQDIIKDFVQEMQTSNDTMSDTYTGNPTGAVAEKLTQQYLDIIKAENPDMSREDIQKKIDETILSPQELKAMINIDQARKDTAYAVKQIAALNLFTDLDISARRTTEIQSYFDQLSQGPGDSVMDVFDKAYRVSNMDRAEAAGAGLIGTTDITRTQYGFLQQAATGVTNHILGDEIPATAFADMMQGMRVIMNRPELSLSMQEKLYDHITSHQYQKSAEGVLYGNPLAERTRLIIGKDSLAHRLQELKTSPVGSENQLLRSLNPRFSETSAKGPHLIDYNSGSSTSEQDNVKAWIDLLTDEDPKVSRFAQDLVNYAILNKAFFRSYVPVGYLEATGVASRMRNLKKESFMGAVDADGVRQFIQHNPQVAERVSANFSELGLKLPYPPEHFTMPGIDNRAEGVNLSKFNRTGSDGNDEYTKYISTYHAGQWFLYERQGNDNYQRVDTLGKSGISEYGNGRSIFPENRAATTRWDSVTDEVLPQKRGIQVSPNQRAAIRYVLESFGPEYRQMMGRMDLLEPRWEPGQVERLGAWASLMFRGASIPDAEMKDILNLMKEKFPELHEAILNNQGVPASKLQEKYGFDTSGFPTRPMTVDNTNENSAGEVTEVAKELGITSPVMRGDKVVDQLLGHLSEHKAVPEYLKVLADALKGSPLAKLVSTPYTLQLMTSHDNQGSFSRYNNLMRINDSMMGGNITSLAETMMHEFWHGFTSSAVDAFALKMNPNARPLLEAQYKRFVLDATPEHFNEMFAKLAELGEHKDLMETVDQLHGLWQEVKGAMKPDQLTQFSYHLSNMHEFMTHAMTDPTFMVALNTIKVQDNRSVMEKLVDLFHRFIGAIGKMLGKDVQEGSALHSAINISLKLRDQLSSFKQTDAIPNGNTGTPDKISFNEGQTKTINEVLLHSMQNMRGKSLEDRTYTISGPGGTGKTTVLNAVLQKLKEGGQNPAVFATTHIARLIDKQNLPSDSVYTLHSGLMMHYDDLESRKQGRDIFRPSVDDYNNVPSFKMTRAFTALRNADVIVVDEASMTSPELWENLRKAAHPNAKVVLVGDYAQLPAVGGGKDILSEQLFGTTRGTRLTENYRTNKSDVLQTIRQYRDWVDSMMGNKYKGEKNVVPETANWPAYNSSNVEHLSNQRDFVEKFLRGFDKNDPTGQIMIVYRNKVRDQLNDEIRGKLFPGQDIKAPIKGDHMLADGELQLTKDSEDALKRVTGEEAIYNGERFIYDSTRKGSVKVPDTAIVLPADFIRVRHSSGQYLEYVHSDEAARLLEEMKIGKYDKASKQMTYPKHIADKLGIPENVPYSTHVKLKSLLEKYVSKSEYAYAVTSHKSQGMEFGNVFVHENDILSVKPTSTEEKARSLYTAVSRARNTLTILTSRPPEELPGAYANNHQAIASSFGKAGHEFELNSWAQVDQLNHMTGQAGNMYADVKPEGVNYKIKVKPYARAEEAGTPLDKAIKLLGDRRHELYESLTELRDKASRTERFAKIEELNTQIEQLQQSGDMRQIATVGQRHLDWIKETLKPDVKDPNAIMTAYRLSDMWSNIVDLLYSTESGTNVIPDDELNRVNAKASLLKSRLVKDKARQVLLETSRTPLRLEDFGSALKDDFAGTSYTLSLDRSKNRLVAELGVTLTGAGRDRDVEMVRTVKRINELVEKGGPVLSKFIEVTDKGIGVVGAYKQAWFDYHDSLLQSKEDVIEKSRAIADSRKASEMRVNAWKKYRAELLRNAVVVDSRKLFDLETGEHTGKPEAAAERERLEKALGKDKAEEFINKAQDQLKYYLDLRDGLKTKLAAEQANGRNPAETSKQFDSWVARNSPAVALSNIHGEGKIVSYNHGDRWLQMAPTRKEFINENYASIINDPKAMAAYQQFNGLLNEMKGYLPLHTQWQMPENFFPYVAKEMIREGLSFPAWVKGMPQRFIEDITGFASSTRDTVPTRFIDRDQRRDVSDYSVDVPRVLEMFSNMALHFKHFSAIKDYADMIHSQLQEISKFNVNKGDAPLTNVLKQAQYNFDYLMYRNPKEKEGQLGKIYSANPATHLRVSKLVTKLLADRHDLEVAHSAGDISVNDYLDKTKAIDDELAKYDGMTMYASRIGDKLITITQLKALSYNPFSAVANVAFGLVSAVTYANGGIDFNNKEYFTAMKMMGGSVMKFLTFGGVHTKDTEKMFNIIERMGIMGDTVDSWYGNTALKSNPSTAQKWWKKLGPYNMMVGSDYYMKGTITLAMMLNKKVDVVEGGVKKTIPLYHALDQEGHWDSTRFGENKDWSSEHPEEQALFNDFRDKAHRVNMIVMGNQDRNSPKLLNKNIVGRLLGQFRLSWLPEAFASRFEDTRYDARLGREIKGRYRTYADLGLGGSLITLGRQLTSIVSGIDPFEGTRTTSGTPMTDADKENMRRNLSGIGFALGSYAAIAMLKAAISPDDDKSTRAVLMSLMNQMIRLKQDTMAYSSPSVFDNITRNVIPATQTITDYSKLVQATNKLLFNSDYGFEKWILKLTKAGLPIPQTTLVNKFNTMATKDIDNLGN